MSKQSPSWFKGTSEGKLYIDTSDENWQKHFAKQIAEFQKSSLYKAIKKYGSVTIPD